ncbi:DUF3179 domain-containing (seleno)protein [Rhodopirellula sp. MGV]|uniref:DUF3179 domain-containing (seleno)protein n=1 Tax=Rhodopirellula sp. MGV TaxID=2023130 RepID=UPI000B9647F6|nr:DUF3179 domain-containing (seleno)protein [Rhodopirellula sp. MGV]OYP32167.1 hypothetical protein CGZ80_20435 [Rhodopirellula sp. MGV]PNY35174.1 DUF3179 domain-containing protein [Rhodopirellula baltica]
MSRPRSFLSNSTRKNILGGVLASVIICASIPLAYCAYQINTFSPQRHLALRPVSKAQRAQELAEQREIDQAMEGNEKHPPLQALISIDGLKDPHLVDASEANLEDSDEVIGVKVEGVECALLIKPMAAPENHIINMMLDDQPVTVTYCDLANCVRVVTDESDNSIAMNIGGLDIYNRMVVELNGELYAQTSKLLPLSDLPFERTTWGAWRRDNSETKVWIP